MCGLRGNIRGLLGMLGEMFREQGLADRELGSLITLDQVYEVQHSALDIDTSNTMVRVLTHCAEQRTREEKLRGEFKQVVADASMDGQMYLAGGSAEPSSYGSAFRPALLAAGTARLPHTYSAFVPTRVTQSERDGLLKKDLEGPSQKFLRDNLGILGEDAARTVATCDGLVPKKVLEEITRYQGMVGASLLSTLARPPYGFDTNVVKASVAGLLRARKVRVKRASGSELSFVTDPGTEDLFQKDSSMRRRCSESSTRTRCADEAPGAAACGG